MAKQTGMCAREVGGTRCGTDKGGAADRLRLRTGGCAAGRRTRGYEGQVGRAGHGARHLSPAVPPTRLGVLQSPLPVVALTLHDAHVVLVVVLLGRHVGVEGLDTCPQRRGERPRVRVKKVVHRKAQLGGGNLGVRVNAGKPCKRDFK